MPGPLNTIVTGRANGDIPLAMVARRLLATKLKRRNCASPTGHGGFGRPLSFGLAGKGKYYNWGEARIFISQGFESICFVIGQEVLQIKTKCVKENARKRIYVGQNFNLKINNFVYFNFDFSDTYNI